MKTYNKYDKHTAFSILCHCVPKLKSLKIRYKLCPLLHKKAENFDILLAVGRTPYACNSKYRYCYINWSCYGKQQPLWKWFSGIMLPNHSALIVTNLHTGNTHPNRIWSLGFGQSPEQTSITARAYSPGLLMPHNLFQKKLRASQT
jgi:hypothetical protein